MPIHSIQAIAILAKTWKPTFNVPWHPTLIKYAPFYNIAARATKDVEPCMLAAIVDNETGGLNILQYGKKPGDPDTGVGVCQITWNVDWADPLHPTWPGYAVDLWDPGTNILVAAREFLQPALTAFPDNHLAAFASYNLGSDAVTKEILAGLSPDAWTSDAYAHRAFTNWINFSAVSLNIPLTDVDWASFVQV